ncbi:MAG: SDR family oxidoreductase [Oceanospirillaceae bacterium]|nr:SDR family oxidoreductase [Oceanospirillaceae bacterium]
MKTLVLGASGATGKLLVQQLLEGGQQVVAIVRNISSFPKTLSQHSNLELIQGSILQLSDIELSGYVESCSAVVSCLGHNMNFKGIYGQPRNLVTEATRRVCAAIEQNSAEYPVKFILMSSSGVGNRDLKETVSLAQMAVIGLLRLLLPPHLDNERAADFLRAEVGQINAQIEWLVLRPDTLIDSPAVSQYQLHPSPIRSAIFNPGQTSRQNVANAILHLLKDETKWQQWRGQFPVIYNSEIKK